MHWLPSAPVEQLRPAEAILVGMAESCAQSEAAQPEGLRPLGSVSEVVEGTGASGQPQSLVVNRLAAFA